MAKNKLACVASTLAVVAGSFLSVAGASATDVSETLTYNDGASGLSTYDISYENGVTSLEVQVRFDGASIEKVLNQSSGVGSTPGSFYAGIDPHYGFTAPFGKGNFNYTPGVDEPETPEDFERGFENQLDECSAYYAAYGITSCDSWAYWSSSSSAFWQTYGYIQYKKDGQWITAPSDKVNFAGVSNTSQIRSNRERLVAALGLESADELEYGVNWRFVANGTSTAWIYRDTTAATYPESVRNEYIKVNIAIDYVFDYMTVDENGNYIYRATLADALASEDNTVVLNKNTVVDTLNLPAGKTLIEREGELTVADLTNSRVDGTYIKADGNSYVIVDEEENGNYAVVSENELAERNLEYVDEDGDGVRELEPIKVDYSVNPGWIEDCSDEDGHVCGWVDFGSELIADRLATLSMVAKDDLSELTLDASKGGELIGAVDIDMLDRSNQKIEVKNNLLLITIEIDKDTYDELSAYDKLYAVYFDENGAEQERFEVKLSKEQIGEEADDYWYYLTFETTHLSTYGVVGVNEETAAAPESGTMTAAGASASVAALVTAIAVGILTSIASFAYLVRSRE